VNTTANHTGGNALYAVFHSGERSSPRGIQTVKRLGTIQRVDMRSPLVTHKARKLSYQFAAAEALWILTGDDRVAPLLKHAPSYAKYSDDGVKLFGAYGPKVVAQRPYVVQKLLDDADTRQAVMTIWRESPPQTKDVPCTVSVQWLIRDGKLHCIDTMRSSDLWLGWSYDVFSFTMLSLSILLELRARGRWVEPGWLQMQCGSQHIYDKNIERASALLDAGWDAIDYQPWANDTFADCDELKHFLWCWSEGQLNDTWMKEVRHAARF